MVYPTTQGTLLQKYLETLVALLSPTAEDCFTKSHSLSSMKDVANSDSATSHHLLGISGLRRSSQAIPPTHHRAGSGPSPDSITILDNENDILDPEDTDM